MTSQIVLRGKNARMRKKDQKDVDVWNISKKESKLQKYFCYPWNSLMTKTQRVFIREKKSFWRGRIYGCVNPFSDAAGLNIFTSRFDFLGRENCTWSIWWKRNEKIEIEPQLLGQVWQTCQVILDSIPSPGKCTGSEIDFSSTSARISFSGKCFPTDLSPSKDSKTSRFCWERL